MGSGEILRECHLRARTASTQLLLVGWKTVASEKHTPRLLQPVAFTLTLLHLENEAPS